MKKYNNSIILRNGYYLITVHLNESFVKFLLNEEEIIKFRNFETIEMEATNGKFYNLKINDMNSVLMIEVA